MRQRRLMNQINVVPYIDVMLVLLVIFMVTAPMIQTGNIDVPTAGPATSPPSEAMIIEVEADRSISVKRTASSTALKVTDLEFQRFLREALEADPEQPFLIAADKTLPYQKVVDVLEAVRTAGVRKVSLQTASGQ
ncbi:ExbD/TolR family protein [Thauera sp. CAU 1555]|uniref:ExbD/TolR family protein n=1 Tax=Thauera sedimentorum TaxID=2767595 RepID=A0ABR9BDK1_9RHOO|nr:ExbD/TolR family protein [Thauera sedimentorum]MBC9072651.1 ExbD/TolR family protein [Thauera sedimentorum]MBD8503570.1 ExbD/TolR family protein [Thauera sedimentorum]